MKTSNHNHTALKTVLATALAISITLPAAAQTGLTLYDNASLDANNNTIKNPGNITQFFDQDQCESDEAIKTVYANGSYACNQLSTTTQAENLSETLAAGAVANQTIEFDPNTGIKIGNSATSTKYQRELALGNGAKASGAQDSQSGITFYTLGTAVGSGAEASATTNSLVAEGVLAIGRNSKATAASSIAIGGASDANSLASISIGPTSVASEKGAVAIGDNAKAPNSYEATFGNLDGEELDVNVTGNLTVHGSNGLEFTDDSADIENIDSVNPGGDTVSTGGNIDAGGEVQTETVASSGRMCIGDRC